MAVPAENIAPTGVTEVKGVTKVAGKLEGKVAFITGAARGQGRFTNKK